MVALLKAFLFGLMKIGSGERPISRKNGKGTKASLPDSKLFICFLTDTYALLPSLEMCKIPSFLLLGRRM